MHRLKIGLSVIFTFAVLLVINPVNVLGQTKSNPDPKAKNKYAPPALLPPDEKTLKLIAEKTSQLRTAIASLQQKGIPDDILIETAIHLKAAENIVRFQEWFHKDSAKWVLLTLDRGLERAEQARAGGAVWRKQAGRWVVRAYRSQVDGSIQPYAVLLPADFHRDPQKKWRLDIVLHGRDATLTEAKFIASHDHTREAPPDLSFVQLEVYGRGNNAYRWAGEADIREAVNDFARHGRVDPNRVVLRGFSMGGAGTWHFGLHHPFEFAVLGPGAGFTATHGYVAGLPNPLPEYQEKTLTIYDAYRYAENVFNVPVVAYSGENDPQKQAAENIEKLIKAYPEPLRFTHLIASGLGHTMPAEWQAKAQAEYQKYVGIGQSFPQRIHFVTYTLRYPDAGWIQIEALEEHYRKAVVDGEWTRDGLGLKTENIRVLRLLGPGDRPKWSTTWPPRPNILSIDGYALMVPANARQVILAKVAGRWTVQEESWLKHWRKTFRKSPGLQGPIDDALMDAFIVVPPQSSGISSATDSYIKANLERFAREWDRWMRGTLPTLDAEKALKIDANLVLFGDPQSNMLIAQLLPEDVVWTKDRLIVNGQAFDPAYHILTLIFPNKLRPNRYVVINSGHTFHETEFKGTNALLYPRLGDWAVLKPKLGDKDSANADVIVAGLFDDNWRFQK